MIDAMRDADASRLRKLVDHHADALRAKFEPQGWVFTEVEHLGDCAIYSAAVAPDTVYFLTVDPLNRYAGLAQAFLIALGNELRAAMMPAATLH